MCVCICECVHACPYINTRKKMVLRLSSSSASQRNLLNRLKVSRVTSR